LKFIHAADIHLDSPLTGLSAYNEAPVEMLRTASRLAFTNLVDEAIALAVDFVIIAGDLYDGTWKDYNTGHYFSRQMGRLNTASIRVILLLGNHDAESEMTRMLQLPDNVFRFSALKPETFLLEDLMVALHGQSFKEPATLTNLAQNYPDPLGGWLNIGVLHTALEGSAQHAPYAPCTQAQLSAKGYDYWALGHVHEHAILLRSPCWIVYPGNIQGRHIRETGARGAIVVTVNDGEIESVERLLVDVLRWHRVPVNAQDAKTLIEVVGLAGTALAQLMLREPTIGLIAVRFEIIGKSEAHGELFGLEAKLRAELIGQAEAIGGGRLWVEKVKVHTSPPHDSAEVLAQLDAIADLQGFLDEAPTDPTLIAALREEMQLLASKAIPEVRKEVEDFECIRADDMAGIIKAASVNLISRLARAE